MRMLVILAAYAASVAAVWIQCEKTRGENFVAYAKVHGNDPHLVFSHPYKPKEVPMHTSVVFSQALSGQIKEGEFTEGDIRYLYLEYSKAVFPYHDQKWVCVVTRDHPGEVVFVRNTVANKISGLLRKYPLGAKMVTRLIIPNELTEVVTPNAVVQVVGVAIFTVLLLISKKTKMVMRSVVHRLIIPALALFVVRLLDLQHLRFVFSMALRVSTMDWVAVFSSGCGTNHRVNRSRWTWCANQITKGSFLVATGFFFVPDLVFWFNSFVLSQWGAILMLVVANVPTSLVSEYYAVEGLIRSDTIDERYQSSYRITLGTFLAALVVGQFARLLPVESWVDDIVELVVVTVPVVVAYSLWANDGLDKTKKKEKMGRVTEPEYKLEIRAGSTKEHEEKNEKRGDDIEEKEKRRDRIDLGVHTGKTPVKMPGEVRDINQDELDKIRMRRVERWKQMKAESSKPFVRRKIT
ncbi:hypothetical protein DICA4_E29888 [Diutina catenulata]